MADLTVALVNWNTKNLVCECIDSVLSGSNEIDVEIIVVDNGSTDGSIDKLRADYPSIRIVGNRDNAGFTRANNQAIEVAHGRHFMLLNSDTQIFPGALDTLVRYIDEHPDVGAVSARTWLDRERTLELGVLPPLDPRVILFAAHDFLRPFVPLGRFHDQNRRVWSGQSDTEVDGLVGACFLVRGETLEKIGPLDEGMFMYFEDADWSRKIRALGQHLVVVRDAEILHYHDQSGSKNERKDRIFEESMVHYFRKVHGRIRLGCFGLSMKCAGIVDRVFRALRHRLRPAKAPMKIHFADPVLRWPGHSDAVRYLVEVGLDPAFAGIAGRFVDKPEVNLGALASPKTEGRILHWRAFGVDANNNFFKLGAGCFTPWAGT